MSVDVALVQAACDGSESMEHRIDRVLDLTMQAAHSAEFVLLPELWPVGAFDIGSARENLMRLDCAAVDRMSAIARASRCWIHMGSIPEDLGGGVGANTSVLIDDNGQVVATYRKVHLFGFTGGETTLMRAGEDLVVVDTPLGRTGLATCYDLRFPELFRGLVDRGAEAFVIASGWPTGRIEHWRILSRARAIENQAVVLACNQVGTHADTELGGHSLVVDALGAVVAEAGSDEVVLTARIDPASTRQWRETFPMLQDRRL